MGYVISVMLGYLLGSSNMAYWVSKIKKVDIRKNGSGNLGASNATVLFGWSTGVLVAIHDIGKAVVAVMLAKMLFPEQELAGVVAGVACVLGHIFPFYLKFKGGKGLASFVGMLLALNWKVAIGIMLLVAVMTLVTDYISVGAMSCVVVAPVGMWMAGARLAVPLIICIASAVMLWKHRENIVRIRNHTEIGLRSTAKGENRVK